MERTPEGDMDIEMASTCMVGLCRAQLGNDSRTSSCGVGMMVRHM